MSAILERNLRYGQYQFKVIINPANVVASMQRDIFYTLEGETDEHFIRSFYFDDIVPEKIKLFCEQFASDASYRQLSIARKTAWAITNDLFLQNCFNPYFQSNPFLAQIGSLVRAYTFFKSHALDITQQAAYQRIYQHDTAIQPHPHQADPAIRDTVALFNQIQGVSTLASCQGVVGVITYQTYPIMTLAPHARFAYLWFKTLPIAIETTIQKTAFQHITYQNQIYPMLVSTGDNTAYLAELSEFAQRLV